MPLDIKELTLQYLLESPLGKDLEEGLAYLERIQDTLYHLINKEDSDSLTKMKAGTVLTFAVLKQIAAGKQPQDFSEEDWKQIANQVIDYAIIMDSRDYSIFVFQLYAEAIDGNANMFAANGREDRADQIRALAEELRAKEKKLQEGEIKETDYIDDCLWIALEVVLKILLAYFSSLNQYGLTELADGGVMYAFEYGRLALFQKEQRLLAEYLEKQEQLDAELEQKLHDYQEELRLYSEQFTDLTKRAYDPDFREALIGSVALAKAAGAEGDEILDSMDKIDDFFLN